MLGVAAKPVIDPSRRLGGAQPFNQLRRRTKTDGG
jgi:hypothetical protein